MIQAMRLFAVSPRHITLLLLLKHSFKLCDNSSKWLILKDLFFNLQNYCVIRIATWPRLTQHFGK
jgi:hypothetical protein